MTIIPTSLKKFFAISLLTIYLFNLVGYALFYHYQINRTDVLISKQIDQNEYGDHQLIELKVALHLPYYSTSDTYERVDGEIEINGVYYNYVKRKITGDSMYLICLPNSAKTQLYKDKNSYATKTNDLPVGNKGNSVEKKNGFSNEYVKQHIQNNITAPILTAQTFFINHYYPLSQGHYLFDGQPPEVKA